MVKSKLEKVAEMEMHGKTAIVFLDPMPGQTVCEKMFCFVEDLNKLLCGDCEAVRFYRSEVQANG